jgi:hypothetical protein
MRTSYIPGALLRAAVNENDLFVFDDVKDQMILRISPISASSQELKARGYDSVEQFQKIEIQRMIAEELQLQSVNIEHLFVV